MAIETLVLNLLVLAVSGVTGLLVTLLFRRIDGIAKDVKELRGEVGEQATKVARLEAKVEELERWRRAVERLPRAVGE